MESIKYYRDPELPFFELKSCSSALHSQKEHYHEELSVGLVEQGFSEVCCNGERRQLGPRNVILIMPEVIHKCTPRSINEWGFEMLYVKQDWMDGTVGRRLQDRAFMVKAPEAKDIYRMKRLFGRLRSHCSAMEKETCLITEIDHLFGVKNTLDEPVRLDSNNIRAVTELKAYIQEHFRGRIMLEDLSACSGLSKYYAIRLFRQAFNTTPHAYQQLLRMNYAKEALKRGGELSEVAQDSGFYDQSHFNKVFRQYFGVTPMDYRSRYS